MSLCALWPVVFWKSVFIFFEYDVFLNSVFVVFYEIVLMLKYEKIRFKNVFSNVTTLEPKRKLANTAVNELIRSDSIWRILS